MVSEDVSGVKCLIPALTRSPLVLVALTRGRLGLSHEIRLKNEAAESTYMYCSS